MPISVIDAAEVVRSVETISDLIALLAVHDNTGVPINPNKYSHAYTYNVDGTVNTDIFTDSVNTWTTTYTYVGGRLTVDSGWVRS
jgi:hypothetical protein